MPRAGARRRRLLRLFAFAAPLFYSIIVLFACLFENHIVFRPVTAAERWIDPGPSTPFRDLEFESDDGTKISARWYPYSDSSKALLYCHPRGGNLSIALKSWVYPRILDFVCLIFQVSGDFVGITGPGISFRLRHGMFGRVAQFDMGNRISL